jgi:addiction module HigA family antidote
MEVVMINSTIHPGQYMRDSVLAQKKLSVTAAAKLVGVGRPALSNFLNGHVTTTPEMASRIEVAFGIPSQSLLDMQAAYDAVQTKVKGAPSNAVPYVAPFLGIKAADIEAWVERKIAPRTRLSVLLRILINSTGNCITKVDFPGNDDAERPGWDGYIITTQPTPWIPEGLSGWEFGTNKDVKQKADSDFAKSVKANNKTDRDQTTFVFVTPQHWPSKDKWIADNKAQGLWKDVRAYDSSDLEQWLETSIVAQAWFANETNHPSQGVRSLDKCWADWADIASKPLTGSLFKPAIEQALRTVPARIIKQTDEPIVIAADSVEEGLAFLAQLFGPIGGQELEGYRDRVLVFNEPGVLSKLAQSTKDFIAVAANREVERELGPLTRAIHTIVVYPRNAANAKQDVVLEPLNYEAFRSSLEEMGYGPDDVSKYNNESGRSLTVLRRRLSNVPAVKTPGWAADHGVAATLIPFLFVGAWSSTNSADQTVLTLLTGNKSYEELERECQRIVGLNDTPLWSVGTYRGVVSKIDLLFAIADSITASDLQHYFEVAKIVLGEDDPTLDLPEDKRWTASIYDKSREFSSALREGITETLVLLAVHGNYLFLTRIGFNCETAVTRLVKELLNPLTTRILEANDSNLAAYAEAAPNEFLSILEEDLRKELPESYGLMRPAGSGVFGGCARTGLLWSLEGLAWNPETLARTALALAQLAEIEINDNWVNKPINSLKSIFSVWMPQTAADHDTRLMVVRLLANKFSNVTWKVCIELIDLGSQIGHYSHKPKWRNDAYGFGEPFKTQAPTFVFVREIIDMILNWRDKYTRDMLCDLIQHLPNLSEDHQSKVWELVKSWADANASDIDKAYLREKIRVTVMSRRGLRRTKKADSAKLPTAAKTAYQALEPSDLLNKHEWLFRRHWVEESADELYDEEFDHHKRDERVTKFRTDALREVFNNRGIDGIIELAEMGEAASQIGWLMAENLLSESDISDFLLKVISPTSAGLSWAKKNLISGALRSLRDDKSHASALNKVKMGLSQYDFVQLLLLAPFQRDTWQMVDQLEDQHRQTYWNDVSPDWIRDADYENNEAVERLLAADRPRAAFAAIHYNLKVIGPELLFRLMSEMVKEGKDQPGQYQLESYYIEKAFVLLNKSPVLTLEQKAGLEFAYIEALSKPWGRGNGYGIPNLEKYVEAHPEQFVQAIAWTYKRSGEGEDPPELRIPLEKVKYFAEIGYKLLEGLNRMPGHDDAEVLQAGRLAAWVKTVRDASTELGRLDIADVCIGKLFSGAPVGNDGVWPCEPVRQVMEEVHSKSMMNGAHTGLYNSRGVVWRGEGGAQERTLAEKYRAWTNALQYSHPFVASQLLMDMVRTYEHEANREDTEAGIKKRLH